ncbi:MAG: hypothetical protein ABW352_25675, partial [Polyangiales bacterium]
NPAPLARARGRTPTRHSIVASSRGRSRRSQDASLIANAESTLGSAPLQLWLARHESTRWVRRMDTLDDFLAERVRQVSAG